MKKSLFALTLVAVSAGLAHAQVVTAPVGFVSVTVPAASDAALGAPLCRAEEFQGIIQSISGNTITVAGTPAWTTNQFVYAVGTQPKTYFARIDSGAKEGLIATIASNGTSDLTITLPAGEDLTNISTNAALVSPATTGDSISIAPYWTPASLITGVVAGTQILRYPTNIPGEKLSSATTYVYTGTNWKHGSIFVDDVTLGTFEGFTLRNNSSSAQTVSITGSVPMTAHRMRLFTLLSNATQDQRVFYNSPIPEAVGSAFPSSALQVGDRLLAFDNSAPGKNKSFVDQLVWSGSQWRKSGIDVSTSYMLQPGASYIFRKNQTATATSTVWSDLQGYLQ